MNELIAAYESLLSRSEQMLTAARAADWDRLAELEEGYHSRFLRVRKLDGESGMSVSLQDRKRQLLQALLEHDEEIRRYVNKRRNELSELMEVTRRQSKLHRAYGGRVQ